MTATVTKRVAGYAAALAMVPYFLIKIVWTLAGLRGGGLHDGVWSRLDWAAVNGLTVAMSGAAIVLGLALAQRWGLRIPAVVLLLPAWIGAGFLVPMIPIFPALLAAGGGDDPAAAAATIPAWEIGLISASFAGFGLAMAVAFPLYVRERWPHAFTGRKPTGGEVAAGRGVTAERKPLRGNVSAVQSTAAVQRALAGLAATAGAVLGAPQVYWALGGTLGLDPAGQRDLQWHVLTGNNGLWAVMAAWAVWTVTHRQGSLRIARLLAFVGSGMLFAWGSWKAIFAFTATSATLTPEPSWVLGLENHFGALTGLAMLLVVVLNVAEARRPSPDQKGPSRPASDAGSGASTPGRVTGGIAGDGPAGSSSGSKPSIDQRRLRA